MNKKEKVDYRRLFRLEKERKEVIKELCPTIQAKSGIYLFYRQNKQGEIHGYVGQSLDVWDRCADHLNGSQYIDISIKNHGLYHFTDNPFGYKLLILIYCDKSQLDKYEQLYIAKALEKGYILKNKTSGSQGVGKEKIDDYKQTKGYNHGKEIAKKQVMSEIVNYFTKYLDFVPKNQNKVTLRKFEEFKELIKNEQN